MIGQLNTEIISQYNEHYAYTPEYRQYLVQLENKKKSDWRKKNKQGHIKPYLTNLP
jgi:hypothetical protein